MNDLTSAEKFQTDVFTQMGLKPPKTEKKEPLTKTKMAKKMRSEMEQISKQTANEVNFEQTEQKVSAMFKESRKPKIITQPLICT